MVKLLIAWQGGVSNRVSATAVAAGARTVRAAQVELQPLEAVDIDRLRWCDGFVLGVHPDPDHVIPALEEWQQALEPRFWDAVQGKFASVFVATPEEICKRTRAHDCAVRLLAAHGMLVTGFTESGGDVATDAASPQRHFSQTHFHREYERLGRFSAGMVHAWIDRAGNPARRRTIGSLVRATRRVSAMRPGDAATDSAVGRHLVSGSDDGMIPITESG